MPRLIVPIILDHPASFHASSRARPFTIRVACLCPHTFLRLQMNHAVWSILDVSNHQKFVHILDYSSSVTFCTDSHWY